VRAGSKLIWYVSLVRQVWLEDVVRVSFHTVKKSSSAELNRSVMAGTSSLQYPNRLARSNRELRRAGSAAEHIPDHAFLKNVIRFSSIELG